VTVEEVLEATQYIQPALELIDARSYRVHPVTKQPRTIVDTIADNAADAGVILGGNKVAPADVDMPWIGAIFSCNGVVEETGLAAGVLGHPANGIAWVARRIAPYGLAIEPGQIILAGSFTRASATRPGDHFVADYGPLGTVTCDFV
jgi:2-oxo-hept-3-ene-1,7-dioate hydratase